MVQQLSIKGRYKLNITFTNMFVNHTVSFSHDNLVTSEGLSFFAGKWANEDNEITKIIVGKNSKPPSMTDKIKTFTKPFKFDVSLDVMDNKLTLTQTNLKGKKLNGTFEIGVIGLRNGVNEVLLSRSTHPIINIPPTCILSLEYTFTLESSLE